MRRIVLKIVSALLVAGSVACSHSTTAPAPAVLDVSGRWTGTFDAQGMTAVVTWTLTQSGAAVTGPALLGLSNGLVLLNGTLNGTVSGSTLTYTIDVSPGGIPTQPACTGQLRGAMAIALGPTSTMAGSMSVANATCTPPITSAAFTLTKNL